MDYIQASEAIRNLARLFKHMEGAADALESVGSMDQAVQEKQAKITSLDAELMSLQFQVEQAKESKLTAELEANSIVSSARSRADAIIDEAQTNAAGVDSRAQADAARVALETKQKAEKMVADAGEQAGALKAFCAQKNKEYSELSNAVEERKAELALLQQNINSARAKIAELLGK